MTVLASLLALSALPFSSLAPASAGSLRAAEQSVARIGHQLAMANLPLCKAEGRTGSWSGFLAESLAAFDLRSRERIADQDGLGPQPVITFVIKGSAADRAGLRVGDVIEAVDDAVFPTRLPAQGSYSTQARLEAAAAKVEALYGIRRGETRLAMIVRHSPGCRSTLTVRNTARLNGRSDGHYAQINAGIVRLAGNDAELAFFVGHEMAHNILGHADWLDKVGRKTSNIRQTEIAADRFALRLMKGAGYDPASAAIFWQRIDRKAMPGLFSDGTHMADKKRIRFLADEARRLNAQ